MQRAEAGKEETGHEPGRKVNLQIHKELSLGTVFYRLRILTVYIIPGILCF
jgi:hypothetical protein